MPTLQKAAAPDPTRLTASALPCQRRGLRRPPLQFLPPHMHGSLSWGLWEEAPPVYSRALETATIFPTICDLCGHQRSAVSMVTAPSHVHRVDSLSGLSSALLVRGWKGKPKASGFRNEGQAPVHPAA